MKKYLSKYPELLSEWHPTKNKDLKPEDLTIGSRKKVWWKCPEGEDIKLKFDNVSTELLEGMIDTIVVSPTFALNRDEIEKQVGHKLVVNFKQPIVDDSIKYEDENNKSKGYNIVNGNKELDVGSLEILKGGRGKLAKKKHRN
jgi:hypothetical protein